jgi:hypothetical protein
MTKNMNYFKEHGSCPFAKLYVDHISMLKNLKDEQKAALKSRPGLYERYGANSSSIPEDDHATKEFIRSIEDRVSLIVSERSKLHGLKVQAMVGKICHIASSSELKKGVIDEELIVHTIESFAEFDRWRRDCLDGLDSSMLLTLAYRGYEKPKSAATPRMFDQIFLAWAKSNSVDAASLANAIKDHHLFKKYFDHHLFKKYFEDDIDDAFEVSIILRKAMNMGL